MRLISLILSFLIYSVALAQSPPPVSLKGQGASSKLLPKWNLQVPNNQATNTGGTDALIETGNANILINPSFEHLQNDTGWTAGGGGTFTVETTNVIHGKQAQKILLTAQNPTFTQDSTLYAAQFAGTVQGLASCRIKSNVALTFATRSAGVTSTTNKVSVPANNTWGLYKIPVLLGATSNGVSIAGVANATGTVLIDDCFVGAVDLKQDVDASRIAGESYFAGTTGCIWPRTSTSIGALTATAACPGPTVVDSSMGSWQTTDSDLPRQTINNLPAGKYKAKFIIQTIQVTGGTSVFSINDGTTTCEAIPGANDIAYRSGIVVECSFTYTSTGSRTFELYTASSSGTVNVNNDFAASPRSSTKFILEYFSNSSTYSSTNADTDWASCGHTTSSFTGFGTVSAIETQCKRDGGDLLMKGKFTSGVSTAVEARLALPTWNGVALTSKGTSVIPSVQLAGSFGRNAASGTYFNNSTLIEPSVGYFTIGQQSSTENIITKALGSALTVNGSIVSFHARIPINGWEQSNIIIGQFNGLESCANSYECTDTFSATISNTGAVTNENLDFINGNVTVTSAGTFDATFKSGVFTLEPNCVASSYASNRVASISSSSSSTIRVTTHDNATLTSHAFKLVCQKQGADYIGKTAKAVASDQSVRSIGSTNVDVQSVYFGSGANCGAVCTTGNCNLCSPAGSKITSVSFFATNQYNVNGIDGTKYNCTGSGYSGATYVPILHQKVSSTTSFARVETSSNLGFASIICIAKDQ